MMARKTIKKRKSTRKSLKSQLDAKVSRQLEIWLKQNEARLRIAQAHYDAQDATTQEVIEAIRDRIVSYSAGRAAFYPNGKKGGVGVAVELEPEWVAANAFYMATQLLKDLATVDVRVANYKFPDLICVECGEPLKPKRKRRG